MPVFRAIAGLTTLLIAFVLWSCGQEVPPQEVLRPVRYVEVYSTGGSRDRTFSGVAKAGVESNLSFKVAGTLQSLPVKVGDRVRTGQAIARIDPEGYRLRVQQTDAALTQAKAQAQKAKADYDRVRGLYENKNASKSQLDAARAAAESASAGVQSARKILDLAKLQLSYTRLSAPSEGSIAMVDVEVNENVRAGQRIVMLTAGSRIEVEVAIPEVLISQVRNESAVVVNFDAMPGKDYAATVREVGVAATGFATTFPVTVRLNGPDSAVRSGMAAEVRFRFESNDQRERMIVPAVAVAEDRDGRFVFVVEPASGDTAIVKRVNVEIGELLNDGLEVFSGLVDGDLVVTAGVSKIQDGQKVKL